MNEGPRLENRLAPDDEHGRPEHPLVEGAWLLAASVAALAAAVVLVGLAAGWLAPHVPFEAEVALAARLLGVVSSDAGAAVAQGVLGPATQIALLGYSREQERQADDEALVASTALYGHAGGLERLLRRLAELRAAAERLAVPLHGAMAPLAAALTPPRAAPSAPSR